VTESPSITVTISADTPRAETSVLQIRL